MGAGVYLDGLEIFHLMPLSPTTQALTRSIKVPALHLSPQPMHICEGKDGW